MQLALLLRSYLYLWQVAKEGVANLLSKQRHSRTREKDLFELPALPEKSEDDPGEVVSSESEGEADVVLKSMGLKNIQDVYQVDVESKNFRDLPSHLQYEVLNELRGKRKQNSWAKMHEMPKEAEGFAEFQMNRLKRRREIQARLNSVSEELSSQVGSSLDDTLFVGDREGMKRIKKEGKQGKVVQGMASR